ncbi:MAG TPA: winged helix-turn-helix domain-containing protein [Myxococcaceae bacterium]|nr:winged helix-turn-helix domain-containing protein [Myxococcaceae bacterium]
MPVVQAPAQLPVQVLEAADAAAALLEPARRRILTVLREPDSSAGVARRLGLPRQRVGHHVRALEAAGLLTCVGERKRRNCVERLLQATARSYVLAPQLLGQLGVSTDEVQDRFSSTYLLAAANRVVQEVSALRPRAEAAGKKLPTLTLQTEIRFASARSQNAFLEELLAAFADLVARHHHPDATAGRSFRLSLFGHPALPTTPASGNPPAQETTA